MKKGVVLIIAFGVMIVISLIALAAINIMRQQAHLTTHHTRRRTVGMPEAQAGIVHAYEMLRTQTPPFDSLPVENQPVPGINNVRVYVLSPGNTSADGQVTCPANAPSEYCIHAHVSY